MQTATLTLSRNFMPRDVYVEAHTNGTAVLSLSFTGSGAAASVAYTDALTMEAFDVRVASIDITSAMLGESPNPPPFEGETKHVFRPDRSPETDQHAVVLYKDAVNEIFHVQDFDVTLDATLCETDVPPGRMTFHWEQVSGPASGEPPSSSSLTATFRNPKLGGVYRFRLTVRCDGKEMAFGEANLVLPLAGAEIDAQVKADLLRADAFAQKVKATLPPERYQNKKFLYNHFRDWNMGDYVGRPDNTQTPSVWYYGQVRSSASGEGNNNYRLGAVCTWKGRPVLMSKASNFVVAYGVQKLDVGWFYSKLGATFFIGTTDGPTAKKSWDVGWDVAQNGGYDTKVEALVNYIWKNEASGNKSKQPWPNPSPPNNYVTPFDGDGIQRSIDVDRQFTSPAYLYVYE